MRSAPVSPSGWSSTRSPGWPRSTARTMRRPSWRSWSPPVAASPRRNSPRCWARSSGGAFAAKAASNPVSACWSRPGARRCNVVCRRPRRNCNLQCVAPAKRSVSQRACSRPAARSPSMRSPRASSSTAPSRSCRIWTGCGSSVFRSAGIRGSGRMRSRWNSRIHVRRPTTPPRCVACGSPAPPSPAAAGTTAASRLAGNVTRTCSTRARGNPATTCSGRV